MYVYQHCLFHLFRTSLTLADQTTWVYKNSKLWIFYQNFKKNKKNYGLGVTGFMTCKVKIHYLFKNLLESWRINKQTKYMYIIYQRTRVRACGVRTGLYGLLHYFFLNSQLLDLIQPNWIHVDRNEKERSFYQNLEILGV